MTRRFLAAHTLLALMLLALPLLAARPVGAADKPAVSASVECIRVLGATNGLPKIEVTIVNKSGAPLHIAYLRAFGTAQDLQGGVTGLKLAKTKPDPDTVILDGATLKIEATWGGVDLTRGDAIVALILTSAGALLPGCGDAKPDTVTLDGTDEAALAKRGAEMIGQLESWRAYPALYALMHPDSQDKVSLQAMSCWYIGQYGPPVTSKTKTIYSTDVKKVKLLDWTWGVTGESYKKAAEITETQAIGIFPKDGDPVESSLHLVAVDGVWRWFFGSTPDGVASLSDSCKLPESV